MNNKLVSVLAGICLALILIIIGEWLYAINSQKQLLNSASSLETKKYQLDEMPVIELTGKSEESYADLVTRPLFIKGRKPVDEPTPEEKKNAAAAVAVKFDWVLNGVYTKRKTLSALFSRATSKVPKDNFRKKIVGEDLDGWKLTEIYKDKVILKQGSEEKELLLRKPKLKELPKIRTSSPPTAPQNQPIPVPEPQQQVEPGQEVDPEQLNEPEIQPEPEPIDENFENSDNEQF